MHFFDKEIVGPIYRNNNLYYVSLDDKNEDVYEINLNEGTYEKVDTSLEVLQSYLKINEQYHRFKWIIKKGEKYGNKWQREQVEITVSILHTYLKIKKYLPLFLKCYY